MSIANFSLDLDAGELTLEFSGLTTVYTDVVPNGNITLDDSKTDGGESESYTLTGGSLKSGTSITTSGLTITLSAADVEALKALKYVGRRVAATFMDTEAALLENGSPAYQAQTNVAADSVTYTAPVKKSSASPYLGGSGGYSKATGGKWTVSGGPTSALRKR